MNSLSDLAAARCALIVAKADPAPEGITLADFKQAMVFGAPVHNMDIFAVLEDAIRQGCTDVDILRTVAIHKLDVMLPGVFEQERQAFTDRVVKTAVVDGWDAALRVLGDIWLDSNLHSIVLKEYGWTCIYTIEVEGDIYGTPSCFQCEMPTSLSLFPAAFAKRLVRTSKCASELPCGRIGIYCDIDPYSDIDPYYEMLYYLKGYSRLHVQRGNTHFTPLKLPEYAVAKAASGLTDKQFRTLWDMFDEYAYFSETPVYEADGKFLTHDYVAWLRHQEEDFDEDVIMAWVTKIRPMCTFLPIP